MSQTVADDFAILEAIRAETQRSAGKFCKCARVIATVGHSQGKYDDELQNALVDECNWENGTLNAIYQRIVCLAKDGKLVVGQGNFGGIDFGPAHPKLTECSITPHGLRLLESGDV